MASLIPTPSAPSSFPSLRISSAGIQAHGAFAEAQATFLDPDRASVTRLGAALEAQQVGIVAHFYMDAELQGVLSACPWPHIRISDSLAMADAAVAMAEAGMKTIVVLGVDFMSENVRAMLDAAGYRGVDVLRVASEDIGCSLAEAADAPAYTRWLEDAAVKGPNLHVIYINTSLAVKARAQSLIPTITCTSSNVVATILQAFAERPEVQIRYGPDTYMGQNLASLFERVGQQSDADIARFHPAHNRQTLARVNQQFHFFEEGTCIVHHMFDGQVVERVRREHPQSFVTAHFEVPGEMFALGFEAQTEGRGVVGSTSNILEFIDSKVREALADDVQDQCPSFVLGTESGMVTAIVERLRKTLAEHHAPPSFQVEIIFPVAAEAVAQTEDAALPLVPGVAAGEGCSIAGGCATCPYMKMNSLDALFDVLAASDGTSSPQSLAAYRPRRFADKTSGSTASENPEAAGTAAQLGAIPILHMRAFQKAGSLPAELLADIDSRG